MTVEQTHKQILLEQQKQLFREIVRQYIAVSSPLNNKQAHERMVSLHSERGLDGQPVSYSTFCRWLKEDFDSAYLARRQDGRVAGKVATQTKIKSDEIFTFMSNVQIDCLHAPIFLVDDTNYRALDKVPIEYLSYEPVTTAILANTTNYESGSERSDYLIEHFKSIFLGKPDLHIEVGYPKPWYAMGLVTSLILDGASANKSKDVHMFLRKWFVIAHMAKTQEGKQKSRVESLNDWFKDNVLNALPGHFNDRLALNLRDTINARAQAALTIREYHIIKSRKLLDYLYGEHTDSKTGETFSREDEWNRQCSYNPPPFVQDVDELCLFSGLKEHRTINASDGIVITRNGKRYWYNSTELQAVRRHLKSAMGKHFNGEVSVTYSLINEYFVWILNPQTKAMLKVPMVTPPKQLPRNSEKEEFLEQLRQVDASIDLTRMSNDEIIKHALARKRKILEFENNNKKAAKKNAESTQDATEKEMKKANSYKEMQRNMAIKAVNTHIHENKHEAQANEQKDGESKSTTYEDTPGGWVDNLNYGEGE